MNILIGADFVPTESNFDLFRNGNGPELFGDELLQVLKEADFRIFNLETPLTDKHDPIPKCGPNLSAPVVCINGYKAAGVDLVTLANNHIMDQNITGFQDTLDILNKSGIAYTGAGQNLDEAQKPYLFEFGGNTVGVYACAEHEFSIADEGQPGANPYDPLNSFDTVRKLRDNCSYVVVLYHGGKEHYRYPSPLLQKVFRKFADSGADIVIAQHTHCIGCMETYKNSTLIYGQGNFLFDHSDSEYWQTSLLIEIDMESKQVKYLPLVKRQNTIRAADPDNKNKILDAFYYRSMEIQSEGMIQKKYEELAREISTDYFLRFSGALKRNIFVRALDKLTSHRFIKFLYPIDSKLRIKNVLDCEAHRELASEIMKVSHE